MLAHWGARSLGPPVARDDLDAGWLHGALRIALPTDCAGARLEFRIGDEHASLAGDGSSRAGSTIPMP